MKGWRKISDRTYMSEKRTINVTEISPKEHIVVLAKGFDAKILKRYKSKLKAKEFMLDYMKKHPKG